jgi:hypothetical protein
LILLPNADELIVSGYIAIVGNCPKNLPMIALKNIFSKNSDFVLAFKNHISIFAALSYE